ncbi:hypothetical protein Dimus_036414 [Dionaea muscipula]
MLYLDYISGGYFNIPNVTCNIPAVTCKECYVKARNVAVELERESKDLRRENKDLGREIKELMANVDFLRHSPPSSHGDPVQYHPRSSPLSNDVTLVSSDDSPDAPVPANKFVLVNMLIT